MSFQIFPRPFRTLRGEHVYSEGERKIADFLAKSNIRYKYEAVIKLEKRKYHPDFYLPDYSIYIEYLGMISDPEYAYKNQLKKIAYYKNNLDVIYIIPQHLNFLETIVNQWIQCKMKKIPETAYVRLCKQYVPAPLTKDWVTARKKQIRSASRFSRKEKMRKRFRSVPQIIRRLFSITPPPQPPSSQILPPVSRTPSAFSRTSSSVPRR